MCGSVWEQEHGVEEVQIGYQEEFLHGNALEGTAQRGGGVLMPGGVQGKTGCVPQCSGLGEKVVTVTDWTQ